MGSFRPRNLTDLFDILRRRATLIAFVTVIVLLAAFVVVINVPHLYESRTRIVVSGQIYDRQANSAQIAAVTEQITSRANLEGLINRYQLFAPVTNMDRATADLANAIKLDTKYRSDSNGFPESFTLTFRDPNPNIAQQVVTDLLGIFSQANTTLEHQATEEARQIRTEIADIEAQLAQNHNSRAAHAASASAASRAASYAERARTVRDAIASSLEQLRDRQYALQQQVANQKRAIVQQQEIVRTAAPEDRGSSSMGALLKRKADLEAQIKQYQDQYTDRYPRLVTAREQLAEVEQRISEARASGEGTRATQASPEAQQLRQMQIELSRMETELEVVERELNRKQQAAATIGGVPAVAAPVVPAAPAASSYSAPGDYTTDGLKERYTQLLKRQEALSVFQPSPAGPAAPFFQIVDEPNLPQQPAAPQRSKLMLFALAMALGAGLVAAVIVELPRLTRINDERDIKYFLGVPVVAQLAENYTVDERRREARRQFARRLRYLLVGAAMIPLLAFVLNFSHVFHILGSK
ncbi:MAG TPA: Wzz/FepE/Etk N-terminal domain-containing protein [Blastocatellia bacterium]|nr:Wzz/FepE/Etk N-terminal domain-containing protein [Blastocatellia bacterium]